MVEGRKGLKDQCNSSSGAIVSAIGHMNHDWVVPVRVRASVTCLSGLTRLPKYYTGARYYDNVVPFPERF
eukprot:scaffold261_cov318-Chaetoceros_neogracile.AAC.19